MKYKVEYRCPSCSAEKKIIYDEERVGHPVSQQDFPTKVICGFRDCSDFAIPKPLPKEGE